MDLGDKSLCLPESPNFPIVPVMKRSTRSLYKHTNAKENSVPHVSLSENEDDRPSFGSMLTFNRQKVLLGSLTCLSKYFHFQINTLTKSFIYTLPSFVPFSLVLGNDELFQSIWKTFNWRSSSPPKVFTPSFAIHDVRAGTTGPWQTHCSFQGSPPLKG